MDLLLIVSSWIIETNITHSIYPQWTHHQPWQMERQSGRMKNALTGRRLSHLVNVSVMAFHWYDCYHLLYHLNKKHVKYSGNIPKHIIYIYMGTVWINTYENTILSGMDEDPF